MKVTIGQHLMKWLQDAAYETYAHNIQVSKDLDAIFAHCPGYLDRSRRS